MKKVLLIVIPVFFCVFCTAICAAQNFAWAKNMSSFDVIGIAGMDVDAAGNIYTTGLFDLTTDFDPGPGTYNLTCAGYYDIFIAKYDPTGNLLWAKQIGAIDDDRGKDLKVDAAGNVYVTGFFRDTVDFDPGAGVFNLKSLSQQNGFVLKLDSEDNFLWAKDLGGVASVTSNHICLDRTGHIYTTGVFFNTGDFDPGPGVYNLVTNTQNAFVSKLDSSGNFVWAKALGGTGYAQANAIGLDSTGNVYISGVFSSTADFDPGSGVYNLTPAGSNDIFIAKLDNSGNFIWAKRIGGIGDDFTYKMATDDSGNIRLTGSFRGTTDFDPGTGVYNLTAATASAIFFVKLNSAGDFVWANKVGGFTTTPGHYVGGTGYCISVDRQGNMYASGSFGGPVDFDPGTTTYNLPDAGGNGPIFILKLDAAGNFLWARSVGPDSSNAVGSAIVSDAFGNVYIAGSFYGSGDFDPGLPVYNLTSLGSQDIFMLKLTQPLLPLNLLSFTAKNIDNQALLKWTTAQEVNTDRFDIERSPNGTQFSKIGTVKANSMNGQYTYTDNQTGNEKQETVFYRLKMLDKDGQYTYSLIRQVTINHLQLTIAPNPVHNIVTISGTDLKTITLADNVGRIVLTKSALNNLSVEISVGHLPKGLYLLTVTTTGGNIQSEKLVVE